MAEKTATFSVSLEDDTSGAAIAAANSLQKLEQGIDQDVKALRQMQKAMKQLQGGTVVNIKAFRSLQSKIDSTKNAVAKNRQKFVELGGTFGSVAKKTSRAAKSTEKYKAASSSAANTSAAFGGKLTGLATKLTSVIGLVTLVTAALAALVAATGGAIIALARYGIAQAGARRSEALRIEGLNTLRQAYGRSTASVQEYQAAIDRASDTTNVGRGALAGYARQLSRAGLRGTALAEAVEAMGIAAQVQGDRGAARFRALAINARLTGRSVSDLAEQYRNRLGPIAQRQMLSIDNQTARLRRNLNALFRGLRIEGFLSAISRVADLFSQSTASGRALKTLMETLLRPIIDCLEKSMPLARAFFEGMIIGALLLTIGFLKVRNALRDAFKGTDLLGNINAMDVALGAGIAVVGAFVLALAAAAAVFAIIAAVVGAFLVVLLAIPAAAVAIGAALAVVAVVVHDFFEGLDFEELGRNMIAGLINGITSMAGRLTNVVSNLASRAADAFTSVLDMGSPSRVFAGFGRNIAQGVVQGVDAGGSAVDGAVSDLVTVPEGGGLGGATTVSIGDININAAETSDPRELAISFRDELASILEGVSIELGAT